MDRVVTGFAMRMEMFGTSVGIVLHIAVSGLRKVFFCREAHGVLKG